MPDFKWIIERYGALLLVLAGLAVLVPGIWEAPLFDRDEPRFAHATAEMMDRGEWIIPYFNDAYRFDKPPVTYWWMRLHYRLFGVNEFAARLHTVISAILLALFIGATGRRWFSPSHGFFAGLGFLTCIQVLIHGRVAVADMPMVLCAAVSVVAAYELMRERDGAYPWKWFILLYLSLAVGFLTKGPIAWLVPALSLALYRWPFLRRPLPWRRLKLLGGLPAVLLIVGAWGIPALIMTNGAFWKVGMGYHVVQRGMDTFNARSFIPGIYLGTAFLSLFPWIAYLPAGLHTVRRAWSDKQALLCGWLVSSYIIFSFYATQLPHYVLPSFPAFFLLLSQWLARQETVSRGSFQHIWQIVIFSVYIAVALAALAIGFFMPLPRDYLPFTTALIGLAAALLGLMLLAESVRVVYGRRLIIAVLVVGAGFGLMGKGLRPLVPAVQMKSFFRDLPENTRYACWRFCEPSLVFYSDAFWTPLNTAEEAEAFFRQDGPCVLVHLLEEKDMDDVVNHALGFEDHLYIKDYGEETSSLNNWNIKGRLVTGVNLAKSSLVKIEVLYRDR